MTESNIQKIYIYRWDCGELKDNHYINGKWNFDREEVILKDSPYTQKPGTYIDLDNKVCYIYSDYKSNLLDFTDIIPDPPQYQIKCTVLRNYQIYKYDNPNCEGDPIQVIPNLVCECEDGSDIDCYDTSLNKARIPKLNDCISEKENSYKIVAD